MIGGPVVTAFTDLESVATHAVGGGDKNHVAVDYRSGDDGCLAGAIRFPEYGACVRVQPDEAISGKLNVLAGAMERRDDNGRVAGGVSPVAGLPELFAALTVEGNNGAFVELSIVG